MVTRHFCDFPTAPRPAVAHLSAIAAVELTLAERICDPKHLWHLVALDNEGKWWTKLCALIAATGPTSVTPSSVRARLHGVGEADEEASVAMGGCSVQLVEELAPDLQLLFNASRVGKTTCAPASRR